MNTSITAAPPNPVAPPRRKPRWWLRGLLLFVALVILGPTVAIFVMMQSARNAWDAAEAEANQLDPRWRLADLLADQPRIPPEENAALHIMAVRAKGGAVGVAGTPRYEKIFEKLPPNAQLNGQQLQLITGQLAKLGKTLEETRLLKDMPKGRVPVTYTDDFISTMIPNHQNVRVVADWLQHDAFVLAQEERYDEALESCQAVLNAGRVFKDDPMLIALLIRIALQAVAVDTIERIVAQGEPSDEVLRVTQAMLEQEYQDSGWLQAIKGERAGWDHLFNNVRSDKIKAPNWSMWRGGGGQGWGSTLNEWIMEAFPSTMLHYYPEHLRTMTRLVEIAKLPPHECAAKTKEWDAANKASTNQVTRLLTPALSKCMQAELRSQAGLRTALVAVACERYRQKHERWPDSLDRLVQDKLLAAIPADPCDGQPLRYRRTKDGVVIYSVGLDGVDNQGNIDRDRPMNPGVDLGFRLWDTALRRLPPLPPVALPEGQ